jgi:hypothetical protein
MRGPRLQKLQIPPNSRWASELWVNLHFLTENRKLRVLDPSRALEGWTLNWLNFRRTIRTIGRVISGGAG